MYPQQRSIVNQNLRKIQLLRDDRPVKLYEIEIKKAQQEKWLLKVPKLNDGSYELKATVFMDNDYGWHDSKPLFVMFEL